MSTTTPFINLLKAAGGELVNVLTHLNNNYDKIDSKFLEHNSRIGGVESLAGVSTNWTTWAPQLITDDPASGVTGTTRALANTVTKAEFVNFGGLVTCDAQFTINQATATYDPATGEISLTMSVPLQVSSIFMLGRAYYYGTGSTIRYVLVPRYVDAYKINFVLPISGGNAMQVNPDPFTLTALDKLEISLQYRTNGVAV